ncbi:MAG TPA: universal stress protein [Polyangia bacterium]
MLNKVLCATDLSRGSDEVLMIAAGFARAFHTSLQVLHVVEPPLADGGADVVDESNVRRVAAETALAEKLERLAAAGVPSSGWVELGRADEVIQGAAAAAKPALLVLGSHGRGPLARMVVGSVAERSLRKATCPTLIVPAQGAPGLRRWSEGLRDEPLRMAVGFDDTPTVASLLGWIQDVRQAVACDVTFVHAFWPPQESRRLGLPVCPAENECHSELGQIIEREIRAAAGPLANDTTGAGTVTFKIAPCWGEVAEIIQDVAARGRADLVVLGTSVGGGASTAISLVRAGENPVLCVPGLASKTATSAPSAAQPGKAPAITSVAVFTDLSETAEAAVAEGAWFLHGRGLLTVCHIDAPFTDPLAAKGRTNRRMRLEALAAKAASKSGVRVQTLVHESPSVAEGIIQAIGRIGPDLVVMSSRGAAAQRPLVPGSVAELVAGRALVPVVIVPPGAAPIAVEARHI